MVRANALTDSQGSTAMSASTVNTGRLARTGAHGRIPAQATAGACRMEDANAMRGMPERRARHV